MRERLPWIPLLLAAALPPLSLWRLLREPESAAPARDLLRLLDQSGDGRVDEAEFARASDGALPFALLDADANGALGAAELELALRHISPLPPSRAALPRVR
jgi:Ca2+-binding EF-hand superfamily protein